MNPSIFYQKQLQAKKVRAGKLYAKGLKLREVAAEVGMSYEWVRKYAIIPSPVQNPKKK